MTEERIVSTSLGLPTLISNSHSPCSLHHCLWTYLKNDMCKSHSTCTLSLRTFSHMFLAGCQYLSTRDLTWIFFVFLIFWTPESDVTLLLIHTWAISNAKNLCLQSNNFKNILYGVIFNLHILLFLFLFLTQVPPLPYFPPFQHYCCLRLAHSGIRVGKSNLQKVWLLLNFLTEYLQTNLSGQTHFLESIPLVYLVCLVFIVLSIAVSPDSGRVFELNGQTT